MIGFIVPIKSKSLSKDWNLDNILLERTIRSICAQTLNKYKLIVVYTDFPEIKYHNDHVIFTYFPYNFTKITDIDDSSHILKYYSVDYAEKMFDKGRKITFGAQIAIEAGCEYIMSIDSDDLISNKIVEYVLNNNYIVAPGWVIKKGYIYTENKKYLIKKNDIQNINGSTHIIRKDLVAIPDFSKNIFTNFNLFESHGYTCKRIKNEYNEELLDFPIPGLIYIISGNNYSNINSIMNSLNIKNIVKKIIKRQKLSETIRSEFGLYKLF